MSDNPAPTTKVATEAAEDTIEFELEIVFVIGPPGCGKTTTTKAFCQQFEPPTGYTYLHLSIEHDLNNLPEGDNITAYASVRACKRSEIVLQPPHVLLPLLEQRMDNMLAKLDESVDRKKIVFFIDGFPMTLDHALSFDDKFGKPSKLIVMHCLRDIALDRFLRGDREDGDDDITFGRLWWKYRSEILDLRRHYSGVVQSILMNGTPEECLDEMIRYRPRHGGESSA
ncbi:P-loop containing nucleoside triphosphate hydrolase protein [Xylariaceae sp. FL1272]|nr:P-loop containing nucleoside triphosphate hydrolase protein [Xylariaceae sp. FL1272]